MLTDNLTKVSGSLTELIGRKESSQGQKGIVKSFYHERHFAARDHIKKE